MTTVIDNQEVEALAACHDHTCIGHAQAKVPGLRSVESQSFIDAGGDGSIAGEYRSNEYLRFENQDDATCKFCQGPRSISLQERPDYGTSMTPNESAPAVDGKMAVLVAEQAAAIARLEERLSASAEPSRRFGGGKD